MKPKPNREWRKSCIAARILLRARRGKLTPRDRRLAHDLAADPGVTDRLLEQAMACLTAPRGRSQDQHVPS